jgi:hypothetical protein
MLIMYNTNVMDDKRQRNKNASRTEGKNESNDSVVTTAPSKVPDSTRATRCTKTRAVIFWQLGSLLTMSDDDAFLLSSDNDSDDDIFSYAKTTFHKNPTLDEETPSSPQKKRRIKGTDTDDALSRLEQRRQHSKGIDILAVDDDSDVEEVSPSLETTTATNINAAIEIDSSDDEALTSTRTTRITSTTPVYAMAQNGLSKEACSRIQQARQASYHLRQAQNYRAEDVWIPEAKPTPPPVVTIDEASLQAPAPTTQNLGPTLRVTLRTTRVVNGKPSDSSTTDTMSIRRLEPFQRLMERYQMKHSISPSESKVQFSVDGQTMDLTKTPASYDIEDEDLIDVKVQILAIQAPVNLGPHIQLVLRTRHANGSVTNDTMSIREQEPLQKLVEKYKQHKKLSASAKIHFQFDGAPLNLTKTPKFYDMETDDIIEGRL